jgi:hypothetical protein
MDQCDSKEFSFGAAALWYLRCMRKALLLLVLTALALPAYAQLARHLPDTLQRGSTGEQRPLPFVEINGRLLKLAPGGVIFDENNRTIVHGALREGARVGYMIDGSGDVRRIYMLTPAEDQQLSQRKRP